MFVGKQRIEAMLGRTAGAAGYRVDPSAQTPASTAFAAPGAPLPAEAPGEGPVGVEAVELPPAGERYEMVPGEPAVEDLRRHVGEPLPFVGAHGPFRMTVPPPSGADLIPDGSATLLSMSVDLSRTRFQAEGRR